jgi:methanogenic corrinoid protein MtbC1/predicted transcriptional regulator
MTNQGVKALELARGDPSMIDILQELAEPSKRIILGLLRHGAKSVNELVLESGLKQPNVSNHLARMRQKEIVKCTKVGRQKFYSLNSPEITEALRNLSFEPRTGAEPLLIDEQLIRKFCRLTTAGEEKEAEATVIQLLSQGTSVIDVYEQFFAPSLALVGKWWEVGAIDVGQEHLASAIVERLMARCIDFAAVATTDSRSAVLACPPGNWHSLAIRMASDILRLRGWRTFFLGADVPIDSILAAVKTHRPSLVLFGIPIADQIEVAEHLVVELLQIKADGHEFNIVAGGSAAIAYEERLQEIGVNYVAHTLSDLNDRILAVK